MVNSEGEIKLIDDSTDKDLMWLLRGNGFNTGVITELAFDFSSVPKHNWNF